MSAPAATALAGIADELRQLAQHVTGLVQVQQTAWQELAEAAEEMRSQLGEARQSLQERAGELGDRGEALAEADIAEELEAAETALGALDGTLDKEMGNAFSATLSRFSDSFGDAHDALQAGVQRSAATLNTAVAERAERLADNAAARFSQGVEQEARALFRQAEQDMCREIADNVVLTQASVAIMGAVGPLVPQLVALRAAVSVIKAALQLARGGF